MSLFDNIGGFVKQAAGMSIGGMIGAKIGGPIGKLMNPAKAIADMLFGKKAKKGGQRPFGKNGAISEMFHGLQMRRAARHNPGLRNVSYGKGSYNLTDHRQLHKFMSDIADGKLDGFRDLNSAGNIAKMRRGRVDLKSGTSYNLATQGGLEAFLRDAKDGKLDGIVTRKADKSLHVNCQVEKPTVPKNDGQCPGGTPTKDTAETVSHRFDHYHQNYHANGGAHGTHGASPAHGVHANRASAANGVSDTGAGPISYPKKNDVKGWTNFVTKHGYSEFMKAKEKGLVGDKVMKDPKFGIELQRMQQEETRYFTMMSNMHKNNHDLLSTIIRNTKG